MTIDSDGEGEGVKDAGMALDPDFVFDLGGGTFEELVAAEDVVKTGTKPVSQE